MSQTQIVGRHATRVSTEDGWTKVIYHSTCVVRWNDKEIVLHNGGHMTMTTKLRMNQASNQYALGFQVYQEDWEWYVRRSLAIGTGHVSAIPFSNGMVLER